MRGGAQGAGVDAPQDSDLYYRLVLDVCFYVGGLGAGASAEVIPAAVLQEAEPDRLRACAPSLVAQWNLERVRGALSYAAETCLTRQKHVSYLLRCLCRQNDLEPLQQQIQVAVGRCAVSVS